MFRCVVCAPGCDDCIDHAPCLYQRDRGLLLVLMVLMMLIILGIAALAALTYYFRTEMVRLRYCNFGNFRENFISRIALKDILAMLEFATRA